MILQVIRREEKLHDLTVFYNVNFGHARPMESCRMVFKWNWIVIGSPLLFWSLLQQSA